MPDLSQTLLPRLRENRLRGLELDGEFILPAYAGQSILNVPASVCQMLGLPPVGGEALIPEILSPLGDGYRQVILLVADALAFHRLQRWIEAGLSPWAGLAQEGVLAPITSITPSTTSAALTTLWTGCSAAVHGITGYEMWLKEYGVVANMISHGAMAFKDDAGGLERAGFSPEAFLPLTTMAPHLASYGVKTAVFQHYGILRSGLSRMYFKEAELHGYYTPSDLWLNALELAESRANERQYLYVYWSELDTFSHRYGPDDERTVEEFTRFSAAIEKLFISRLSPAARKDTLLILVADHGQITTPPDPYYDLHNHPGLTRRLHIQPTGENRLAYLYVRPGQTEAVREYLERTWPNQFILLDPAYAVEMGLFGPGQPHPALLERLGDFILVAKGGAYLWWSERQNILVGRHGGLHPQEMLTPFLAVRLG